MKWVKDFYSVSGHWWGPGGLVISDVERKRVEIVKRLGGTPGMKILELGASYGETAAAFAEAGFDITGVELSDRADYSEFWSKNDYKGKYKMIKDDFYQVSFDEKFDIVTYWNGFGIGIDEEQRKLLRKISDKWLKEDGFALIDIFNPITWANWDGEDYDATPKPEKGYKYHLKQHIEFDPITSRFIDTWWEADKPAERHTQNIRCYSIPDFKLLLEGTGLKFVSVEAKGKQLEDIDHGTLMNDTHEYLVKLIK